MSRGIFLIHNNERLVAMKEEPYASEDLLQRLLVDYPDLLAGDQMNAAKPRRWLLIKREAGVPGDAGGTDRWSIDHLFLDQDGIPTLIEVKRSSDTRIRREVVGQILDYAANAVMYWPVDHLYLLTRVGSRGIVATLKERRVLATWNNLPASPEELRGNASVVFLKTTGCSREGKSVIPKTTDHLALGVDVEANPLPCRSHLDMFNVVVTNQRVAPSDT